MPKGKINATPLKCVLTAVPCSLRSVHYFSCENVAVSDEENMDSRAVMTERDRKQH